jgi:hypothetical protein
MRVWLSAAAPLGGGAPGDGPEAAVAGVFETIE